VSEAQEGNNTIYADYAVGQPELTVSSFSASVSGGQVSYTAQVCNSGSAVTTAFSVGIYYDRASEPGCSDAPDHTQSVASLGAGACTQVTATQSGAATGSHKAWAFADHLCQVTEASESNNRRSYDVGVGVDQPDLKVTNLTVTADAGGVSYTITVCNAGAAAAAASQLGLAYDAAAAPQCGDPFDWLAGTAALATGECETANHRRTGVASGSYKAWARADATCAVGESDEGDNTASHSYSVASEVADLALTALRAVGGAGQVAFVATVCNAGRARAPETTTALYYHRADAPAAGCGVAPDLKLKLEALDGGQCVNQTLPHKGVAAGSYRAWVLVDGACALAEADEANNQASVDYAITAAPDGGAGDGAAAADGGAGGCGCGLAGGEPAALLLLLLLAPAAVRRWRARA
jgi:subtilase family serine protease